MIQVDEKELIRRAYLLDGKSERQIATERKHSRNTVAVAIADPKTATYHLTVPRAAPVMDSVKEIVNAWLLRQATLHNPPTSPRREHAPRRI